MNQEKTVSEAIQYRRSVRIYDAEKAIDKNIVKKCIQQATLAPNSSNMQLWEFYHITSKDLITEIAPFCFNQNAAKTAQQLVVFITRYKNNQLLCCFCCILIETKWRNFSNKIFRSNVVKFPKLHIAAVRG